MRACQLIRLWWHRMKFQLQCSVVLMSMLCVACGNPQNSNMSEQSANSPSTDSQNEQHANANQKIKPAKKLTNDASAVANEAWILINQLDQLIYAENAKSNPDLDGMVREPLRELSTRWRIEVKMTDSVTEGKYALCRKSLNSLDAWARSVQEQSSDRAQKQLNYERDKQYCKDAIENPKYGNTPPKISQAPI